MRVEVDRAAIEAMLRGPIVEDQIAQFGDAVAELAQQKAPRNTGGGAESIHSEIVRDDKGFPNARITWDKAHFYMAFHELGTMHERARPFLRPALFAVKRGVVKSGGGARAKTSKYVSRRRKRLKAAKQQSA